VTPGQKGKERKNGKKKDSGKALLYYQRETNSETINRTPGLPSLPTLVVDAEDDVDDGDDVDDEDDVDGVDVEVPLRAMASAWKAEKLRADDSSELIAKTMP